MMALSRPVAPWEFYMRVDLALELCVKDALLRILHNEIYHRTYVGLPRNDAALHRAMLKFKSTHKGKLNRILRADQWLVICPQNGKTNSQNFDIPIIVILTEYCLPGLPAPAPPKHWDIREPLSTDQSIAAFCLHAKLLRHEVKHGSISQISTRHVFQKYWNKIKFILGGLHYNDFPFLQQLELGSLDPYLNQQVQLLIQKIDLLKQRVDDHDDDYNEHDVKICILEKKYEEVEKTLEDVKQRNEKEIEKHCNPYHVILPEVLNIICKKIGKDWAQLSKFLLTPDEIKNIENLQVTEEHKMDMSFRKKNATFTWNEVKNILIKISREDIVDCIRMESLITTGLRKASVMLREKYNESLSSMFLDKPLCQERGVQKPREEIYVHLSMVEKPQNDPEQQSTFNRLQTVPIQHLLKKGDDLVILRGLAGIGKSTFMDTYVYNWAKGNILNEFPKIDFIFYLKSEDLKAGTFQYKLPKKFIRKKFTDLFDVIDIQDLQEVSHRVLFVVDGVDEIKSIHLFSAGNVFQPVIPNYLGDIMNNQSSFLRGHKTVVTGRPSTCSMIAFKFRHVVPKTIEVHGFNSEAIDLYIQNRFHGNNDRINLVTRQIRELKDLQIMARIPFYLWVICEIFDQRADMNNPHTITQLCSTAFLEFTRSLSPEFTYLDCFQMCQKDLILHTATSLAKLSEVSLRLNKPSFSDADVDVTDSINSLERAGLLIKKTPADGSRPVYQFKHLVLQEYFTALHVFLNPRAIVNAIRMPNFSGCVPLLAGLSGIDGKGNQNDITTCFLSNLKNYAKKKKKEEEKVNLICECLPDRLFRVIEFIEGVMLRKLNGSCLVLDGSCDHLLAAIFEYQGEFSSIFQRKFSNKSFHIRGASLHHEVRNTMYFINKLEGAKVDLLHIQTTGHNELPENLVTLFTMYYSAYPCQKILKISSSVTTNQTDEVLITCQENVEDSCRTIEISGLISKIYQNRLLLETFCVVDVIQLHCQVESAYKAFHHLLNYTNEMNQLKNKIRYKIPNLNAGNHRIKFFHLSMLADAYRHQLIVNEKPAENLRLMLECCFVDFGLNDDDIDMLTMCLPSIKLLNISCNEHMSSLAMQSISTSLTNCIFIKGECTLKILHLDQCSLTDAHLVALKPCIPHLQLLSISRNVDFTSDGMTALCEAVIEEIGRRGVCNLVCLFIASCNLADEHISCLQPMLHCLHVLCLSGNDQLSASTLAMIANSYSNYNDSRLKSLDISKCLFTYEDLLELDLSGLEKLVVGDVSFSARALQTISNSIIEHTKEMQAYFMEILDLTSCQLTDSHVWAVLPCVRYVGKICLQSNNLHYVTNKSLQYIDTFINTRQNLIRQGEQKKYEKFRSEVINVIVHSPVAKQSIQVLCLN